MSHLSRFVTVWSMLQAQVASGRLPGFAAAVRHRGEVEVRTGGCLTRGGSDRVDADSLFRLSSLSKPYAGALTLALAEDGVLGLDDPVARWLPELAEPRVLRRPGADLSDAVAADRPITVRHLLSNTAGLGRPWDGSPLDEAIGVRDIGPGPFSPGLPPDEYLARWAELPLAAQPGERWLYHACSDVLSVLLARAAGRSPATLLAERVTGPLGSSSTGFWARDRRRLGAAYQPDGDDLTVLDPVDGVAARPPVFEGLAAGLVSTAPETLAFLAALADGGGPVLAPGSVAEMTTDVLTAGQRADAGMFLGPGRSWGLQVGLDVTPSWAGATPGRWGWDGGTGTSGWADPGRDLVAVLLTNRGMGGPDDDLDWFWHALYRCL
jgi:CubicO group peptidase (beta-lactamase class C family)